MKQTLLLLCLTMSLLPGHVKRVIDGDTFILFHVGTPNEERVRLLGVNSPEKFQPHFFEAMAFTVEDILNWLGTHGPVVLGTNWYQGMFEADKTGLIVPTGSLAGGHAYLVLGYDEATKRLLCQNSWGTGWGLRGRFSLHYEDAERLLHEDGEACTPVE